MFKFFSGFLLIIGALLAGFVLWWIDQEDASETQLEQEERYWNPMEDVPELSDFFSKKIEEPSLEQDSEKTFLLAAASKSGKADHLPIVFAKLEPATNDIKMTSISISDLFQANSGLEAGQAELKNKAEEYFNTMIDAMITVDIDGFAKLVNEIVPEGIKVTITDKMVNELGVKQEPGTYTLYGEDLFANEYGLVLMQPEVINTIKETITAKLTGFDGMIKLPSLLKESQAYVKTDMDFDQLISLVSTLATDVKELELESIPVEGEAETDVLIKDSQAIPF